MNVAPYLQFDGRCAEAFAFYAKCLDGTVTMTMTYEGSPMASQMPAEMAEKIMHAQLTAGTTNFMGSDTPPGRYQKPQGFSISVTPADTQAAEQVFTALSEHGHVDMPLQTTFWAARFGVLTDQFGVSWMVNCEA